jgi:hypothetical protein
LAVGENPRVCLKSAPIPDRVEESVSPKIDFKKDLACYQARLNAPHLVEVPDMQYLMIDGHGDPNSEAFERAIRALYPIAYKLKLASRRQLDRDYVVPPLEGLWWADDMDLFTTARDKSGWNWTALIMTPEWITSEMFDEAISLVGASDPPARLDDVRMDTLSEGTCVQALHIGPFDEEGPLLEQIHREFIPARQLQMALRHHEIYLSDPRKTAPAKLRTILRQPVRDQGSAG